MRAAHGQHQAMHDRKLNMPCTLCMTPLRNLLARMVQGVEPLWLGIRNTVYKLGLKQCSLEPQLRDSKQRIHCSLSKASHHCCQCTALGLCAEPAVPAMPRFAAVILYPHSKPGSHADCTPPEPLHCQPATMEAAAAPAVRPPLAAAPATASEGNLGAPSCCSG